MTASDAGKVDVQHLCKLAGVSRASSRTGLALSLMIAAIVDMLKAKGAK